MCGAQATPGLLPRERPYALEAEVTFSDARCIDRIAHQGLGTDLRPCSPGFVPQSHRVLRGVLNARTCRSQGLASPLTQHLAVSGPFLPDGPSGPGGNRQRWRCTAGRPFEINRHHRAGGIPRSGRRSSLSIGASGCLSSTLGGMEDGSEIVEFYESLYDEAARGESVPVLIEFARTQEIVRRYLTTSGLRVADIGGGPGRHTRRLAGPRRAPCHAGRPGSPPHRRSPAN